MKDSDYPMRELAVEEYIDATDKQLYCDSFFDFARTLTERILPNDSSELVALEDYDPEENPNEHPVYDLFSEILFGDAYISDDEKGDSEEGLYSPPKPLVRKPKRIVYHDLEQIKELVYRGMEHPRSPAMVLYQEPDDEYVLTPTPTDESE